MIKTKITMVSLTLSLALGVNTLANAADDNYPYTLPNSIATEVNIDTSKQEPFNNKLLGTNIHGFTNSKDQEMITLFDPLTVRFPHGLWANWYDWELDKTRVFGTDTFQYKHADGSIKNKTLDHLSSIKIFEASSIKIGINGLTELNTARKSNTGSGYDMLWTFNMSADGTDFTDGSPVSVARYNDLIARGFEVNAIEMGNENFYPGQRSSIIPNAEDYLKRAKSMSAALKALDPTIKVSVPLLRRDNWANPNWNVDLTEDLTYFDAVTVHTYVGSNPDEADSPAGSYSQALIARHHIATSVDDYADKVAPTKPIWLSEWGVKSGGPNAASVIGMTDVYMFLSENQNRYERANWFSVNGQLNSFLKWETYESPSGAMRPRIQYPLIKTAFGSAHQIMRSVLQDSTLLESTSNSIELEQGVKAISTRAVMKDGTIELLVLNKANIAAPYTVKVDGSPYLGTFLHKTMKFNSLGQEREMPIAQDPLTDEALVGGEIVLPPLSINKITLSNSSVEQDLFTVDITTIDNKTTYQLNENIEISALVENTSNEIKSVTFTQNDQVISIDNTAPYKTTWPAITPGVYDIVATAKASDDTEEKSLIKITVEGAPLNVTTGLSSGDITTVTLGESIALTATSATNYGSITKVEIVINDAVVHQSTDASGDPISYNWQPTAVGAYQLTSQVTQSSGQMESSTTLTINVVEPKPEPEPEAPDNSNSGGSTSLLLLLSLSLLAASRKLKLASNKA